MNWWHTIELPDGTVTPGRADYRGERGDRFLLPDHLQGLKVIDFGTWDGYWAIEAKRRGAEEVLAVDRWEPMLPTAEFALDSYNIPYICSGDLDFPMGWGQAYFDIVLFYGILYHLKNPVMGLMNAAKCCKPGGMVIVETAVSQGKMMALPEEVPLLWVIDEVHHGDPSNYMMPNVAAVNQLCRLAGLIPGREHFHFNGRYTVQCEKERSCQQ